MRTIFASIIILIFSTSYLFNQELLDFGKFNIKILEVKKIENFIGEHSEVVKASKRSNQLFEITMEIISSDEGEFGLYPKMFNCMGIYRDEVLVVPAVALGTKVKDKSTGMISEYWYNDPDVSIIIGVGKNEKFIKYVIIELPKETEKFYLQGPQVIAEIVP